jgi:uncharacterized protein (DUF1330 family)
MPAYAVAHLRNVAFGPDIIDYLNRIDATLAPFEGRFLIHGGDKEVLEGDWPGDLVVIAFPDRATASAWYRSPAYRDILALRTDHSDGDTILIDGVSPSHRAVDKLAKILAARG